MTPDVAVDALPRRPTGRLPAVGRMLRNRLVFSGSLIIGGLSLIAILAPLIAPHDPIQPLHGNQGLDAFGMPRLPGAKVHPPARRSVKLFGLKWTSPASRWLGARTLLGTDQVGRDLLSRVFFGARISLLVGVVAMLTALVIGVTFGLLAGYWGGKVDFVLMRFTDIMMTFPSLLLAIAFAGLMNGRKIHLHPSWLHVHVGGMKLEHVLDVTLERGLLSMFFVIGIVSWTTIARVVRAQTLSLKEREFVEAACAIGCSHSRIILRHILPNILPVIVVLASMSTAGTILLDAGLSYLGIGIPPPTPSWGSMISDGQPYLITAPWMVLAPGLAVVLAVVGFNLLGQGLQDVLDPHHHKGT